MSELALQKLNELREVAPEEVTDLIDGLATLLVLRQDMTNPMLGAKVTLWLRPPTRRLYQRMEDTPEGWEDAENWQYRFSRTLESPDDEHFPWRWDDPPDEDEYPVEAVAYDHKKNGDDPDLVGHEAIVIEGNVGESAPDGPLWDPNEGEYRTRRDYPLGTINCVVAIHHSSTAEAPDDLLSFSEDYPSDVEVYTSITPADGDPRPHEYTPGWN